MADCSQVDRITTAEVVHDRIRQDLVRGEVTLATEVKRDQFEPQTIEARHVPQDGQTLLDNLRTDPITRDHTDRRQVRLHVGPHGVAKERAWARHRWGIVS